MRQAEYSSKVQQPPRTAASSDDRQHTQLAGTTAKRSAAPLVRDEEAAGSNPATPTRSEAISFSWRWPFTCPYSSEVSNGYEPSCLPSRLRACNVLASLTSV